MGEGADKLWCWFGLDRATFCVMPRVLMHAMPDEWQGRMADLLNEYQATFDTSKLPACKVMAIGDKDRFASWPGWLLQYRHPDYSAIEALKEKPCEECGKLAHECPCIDAVIASVCQP